MHLVRLTLHVDAFDMAQGGAWEVRSIDGVLIAQWAFPGFAGGERSVEEAAGLLANHCRIAYPGGQLELF